MKYLLTVALCTLATLSWGVDAQSLSQMDAEALQREKAEAEQAALLAMALLDGQSEAKSVDKEGGKKSAHPTKITRRSVRNGEPSFAQVPPTRTPGDSRYQTLLERGAQMGWTRKTTSDLRDFVKANPAHRDARIQLARVLLQNGNPESALAVVTELVTEYHRRSHPDWQPWFWAGSAYLQMGNAQRARQMLDTSLSKKSDVAATWIQFAVLEQEAGNCAAALQYLDIAAELEPQRPQVHLNRAYCLERLKQRKEAVRAYQRYLVAVQSSDSSVHPAVIRHMTLLASNTTP